MQRLLAEFRYFVPDAVNMLSASTNTPAGVQTADAAKRWADNGEIEEAARRLMRYSPDCFAYYGCEPVTNGRSSLFARQTAAAQ